MTRQSPNEPPSSPAASETRAPRVKIEMSVTRAFAYGFLLFTALSWMFVFGILIGRGLPLVTSEESSYKADFMRFLGLGREKEPVAQNAAESWDNPRKVREDQKKILQSLNYYEDLTQKSIPVPSQDTPPAAVAGKGPSVDLAKQKQKIPPVQAEPAPVTEAAKPAPTTTIPEAAPPPSIGEHFTLLIASLRDVDNAQRMVEQLKSKGYPARLESIDLNGGGRWNRVLVGSFESRDGAMRFASDFNRKERTEGLVIRESN